MLLPQNHGNQLGERARYGLIMPGVPEIILR